MLGTLIRNYDRATTWLSGRTPESIALLMLRVALAGVFWRSGQSKLAEGSAWQISETTYVMFQTEYAGVPLPAHIAAVTATVGEHLFPALLLLGLFTRLSALSLLAMTMVIQIFVYPEAWWAVHILWAAMAVMLICRGGGVLSLDAVLTKARHR